MMRFGFYGVGVMSVALFWSCSIASAKGLSSHQALYEINLWSSSSASSVESVVGRTSVSLKRACDGWHSAENYAINFGFNQGQTSEFLSHYESWESIDGSNFSFSVEERSTSNGQKTYDGFANVFAGFGEANYFGSEEGKKKLPSDTLFPVEHLKRVLEAASRGDYVYRTNMFVGGEIEDSHYFVSSVVGAAKTDAPEVDLGDLAGQHYWPLRMAYFDPEAVSAQPEYEIEFMVQDNGVILSYIVDYGDFSIRGNLSQISPLDEPVC